jgi:hypothetical protein
MQCPLSTFLIERTANVKFFSSSGCVSNTDLILLIGRANFSLNSLIKEFKNLFASAIVIPLSLSSTVRRDCKVLNTLSIQEHY